MYIHQLDPSAGLVAGVDEAGRGPLAGPVIAAAVILDPDNPVMGLQDSKQLSPARRESLYAEITVQALAWATGRSEVAEIDAINILQATLLAMRRAVEKLVPAADYVLVDGNRCPQLTCPAEAIIKGDSRIPAISAASILAKVTRDRLMVQFNDEYPGYAFDRHKGYGTPQHRTALAKHGPCRLHRMSYAPLKILIEMKE